MRLAAVLMLAVTATLLSAGSSRADKRVALVIGNGDYKNVGALQNPPKDAASIAAMLTSSGFQVVARRDVGIVAMRRAVSDFADIAGDADVALVYYAGHGIEVDGANYLIPTDATLQRDFDVEDETISLDRVLRAVDGARRLRLVILDACRDNPFARGMRRTTRSIGRGLARVDPTSPDTLIAFAAKAGSVAADGDGSNSPFTTALLRHLTSPGLDIRLALGNVRDEVLASTRPKQEPFVYGSLGGRTVALVEAPAPQATAAGSAPDVAERVWAVTQNTTSVAVLEAFVRRFEGTAYADLAHARMEELKKSQTAVASPAVTPAPAAPAATATSLEARARGFLEDYMRESGSTQSSYLAMVQRVFDSSALYYGKRTSREAILEEQRKFVARWPQRIYRLKPEATNIECEGAQSSCLVSGDLDYINTSPANNQVSSGVWHYEFRVVLSGLEPKIVEETGHTVTKQIKPLR